MAEYDEAEARREAQKLILEVLDRKKVKAKLEDIKEGVSLAADLGIDSLDVLQICFKVEKKFNLRFSEDEIKSMTDLGSILKTVKKRLTAQA